MGEVTDNMGPRSSMKRRHIVLLLALVVFVCLMAMGAYISLRNQNNPRISREDQAVEAQNVQATIKNYDQKSNLFTQGSVDFVNAKGQAAFYAAQHDQCDQAKSLLRFDTDGSEEAKALKKEFDDEVMRLCK